MFNNPYPYSTNFQAKRTVLGTCHWNSGNISCIVSVLDPFYSTTDTNNTTPTPSPSPSSIYINNIQVGNDSPYCYIATVVNAFAGYYNNNTVVITDSNGYTYTWSNFTSDGAIVYMYLNNTPTSTTNPKGCEIISSQIDSFGNTYYTINSGKYTFSITNYTTQTTSFTFGTPNITSTPPSQSIIYNS